MDMIRSEPEVRFVTLTPQLARELLALNDPARTEQSDLNLIDCYAQQMRANEWRFTGDTFKVNTRGRLIDGQHRLQAAIKAGWSGTVLICLGVPTEAAWAMDPPGGTRNGTLQ